MSGGHAKGSRRCKACRNSIRDWPGPFCKPCDMDPIRARERYEALTAKQTEERVNPCNTVSLREDLARRIVRAAEAGDKYAGGLALWQLCERFSADVAFVRNTLRRNGFKPEPWGISDHAPVWVRRG